jgi:hypothetical protein
MARLRLADWTILLTHVPPEMLGVQEALVLMRWSFQIELLWKLRSLVKANPFVGLGQGEMLDIVARW